MPRPPTPAVARAILVCGPATTGRPTKRTRLPRVLAPPETPTHPPRQTPAARRSTFPARAIKFRARTTSPDFSGSKPFKICSSRRASAQIYFDEECADSRPLLRFWGRLRRAVFQNFAGLALQVFANGCERGEADGFGLAGFEDGEVLRGDVHAIGQIVQPHFALGENHVEIDDYGHKLKPSIPAPLAVPVLLSTATRQKPTSGRRISWRIPRHLRFVKSRVRLCKKEIQGTRGQSTICRRHPDARRFARQTDVRS